MGGARAQDRRGRGRCAWPWLLAFLLLAPGVATLAAQTEDDPPESTGGTLADAAAQAAALAAEQAADSTATETPAHPGTGFLLDWTLTPVAGVRANVRQYTWYTDIGSTAKFADDATAAQTFNWSWDNYRRQQKSVENRKGTLNYGFGRQLPLATTIDGSWNWSEDRSTNTAGFENLLKVDNKLVNVNAMGHKLKALGLVHAVRVGGNFTDQASLNQGQRNDFREGTAGANVQSGWSAMPDVVVVGRLAGTTTGGTRLLAGLSSPSSASGDSVGVGVYFNRGFNQGFVQMTRSNFEKKYLEFRRNANGLVDTVGVPDAEKVVRELESKDAVTLQMDHKLVLGSFRSAISGSHTTDDVAYAVGAAGLKQRTADVADVTMSWDAGRDSVAVVYNYKWRWDDQRIRAATASRGRQYVRERDLQVNWQREMFAATRLMLQYHEGLAQDIAERRFNENDKDRLQRDLSARLDRNWLARFRASLVFSYRQSQDISIRGGSSSNNNVKDSYELAPGFTWNLAPGFVLDQSYRLYIQYTDYLYSHLPTATRKDDYNKRGDLVTKVTYTPNDRLTVTIRHDYNRRFNATKSTEDAAGDAFYSRDLEQDISKIDLDLAYTAAPGVTLEAGTYRTRDNKTALGRVTTRSRTDSGDLMIGGRLDRAWGARQQFVVSGVLRKINAFGPSVTASSADYWEADVWFKWIF